MSWFFGSSSEERRSALLKYLTPYMDVAAEYEWSALTVVTVISAILGVILVWVAGDHLLTFAKDIRKGFPVSVLVKTFYYHHLAPAILFVQGLCFAALTVGLLLML